MLAVATQDELAVPPERGSAQPLPTPVALTVRLTPRARFDAIDVSRQVRNQVGDGLAPFPRVLYCSHHTTAGFLEQSVAHRLARRSNGVGALLGVYRNLFPEGADYYHDRLHLRQELSPDQRLVEPRNADSHLAFIGAGLRSCVTYANRNGEPVHLVDLDGVSGGVPRTRFTLVVGYTAEELVRRERFEVPVSRHPIDSVNLADPAVGLMEFLQDLVQREGIEHGRVDISLGLGEREAAVTVNEYETLLMRHDLAEVLRDPLRFLLRQGRRMLADPAAIPAKTLGYARYDVVLLLKGVIEALGLSDSTLERLLARAMALPAARLLRLKRSVTLPVLRGQEGSALVRGKYQSPILLQWGAPARRARSLVVTLKRFR